MLSTLISRLVSCIGLPLLIVMDDALYTSLSRAFTAQDAPVRYPGYVAMVGRMREGGVPKVRSWLKITRFVCSLEAIQERRATPHSMSIKRKLCSIKIILDSAAQIYAH